MCSENNGIGVAVYQILMCVTLSHMSIGAGIIAAVPLQEIDNAPHAQASAESHNKGLQSINSGRKELHIASISPGSFPAMKKAAPFERLQNIPLVNKY